jgi:serine/threonine protein kinase
LDSQFDAYLNPLSRIPELDDTSIINKLSGQSNFQDDPGYREELCYLAPEIFSNTPGNYSLSELNMKTDQYMLGLLGYELLTGYIPDTLTDIKSLKQNGANAFKPLKQLTEIRSDCSQKFARIIHRMINFDPDKRYNNLKDAIDELNGILFNDFEIAKESYSRCISNSDSGEIFFRVFYKQLLNKLPEDVVSQFKKKGIGEAESNRQYAILREAVFILLMFGENKLWENEPNILTRIAKMHSRENYNVSPALYQVFVEVLVNTVCGLLPDVAEPFDVRCKSSIYDRDNIREAWMKALSPGIEYMESKY